jgi:hypothetical protein
MNNFYPIKVFIITIWAEDKELLYLKKKQNL